jgi:hypothetical protein
MSKLYSPARTTFNVPTGKVDDVVLPVHIAAPDVKAENLPLSTWTASVVLAGELHRFDFFPATSSKPENDNLAIPVLELGAGTGLVGLSAACLWKQAAILSDLAPIVPGLDANIVLNKDNIAKFGGSADCGILDWSAPASLTLNSADGLQIIPSSRKARVVLAADTIYGSDHPELLTNTILKWLEKSTCARLCICYPLRVAYLDEIRELWQRLEQGGLKSIQEGKKTHIGDSPNGDDEALCEWSVWRWKVLP